MQEAAGWVAVVACAGLLALVVVAPTHLRRRAEMLRSNDR